MSATSPRRSRRSRLRAAVESLEARALLTALPTAASDAYSVLQGQTLTISTPRNELHTEIDNYQPAGPHTWTEADGPIHAAMLRPGAIQIQGAASGGSTSWILRFGTQSDALLVPGTYAGNTDASVPGAWVVVQLFEYGTPGGGGPTGPTPISFTIHDIDAAYDGTVTRVDADFTIDGVAAGSVHYSTGPRGLFDNDSGPADAMTASLVTGPAHGSLSLNPDGTFSYTPDPGFAGTDSFTYAATDGTTTSAPAAVTLNVLPVNQPPSFTKGQDVTVTEDAGPQSISNWATNISPGPNASDAGQSVSFSVVGISNPALFSQAPIIDSTGKLTFTPAPDASGAATITIALHDSGGTANGGHDTSATQTFTITVMPVNDAPVLLDQTVWTTSGQTAHGTISWLDDSPAVTITVAAPPQHGLLSLNPDGTFAYTPAGGFAGADTFQVVGNDGLLGGAPATVTVNVVQVNQAPSFTKGPDITVVANVGFRSFAGWATNLSPGTSPDEASQSLTFSVTGDSIPYLFYQAPAIDPTGTLTFTPNPVARGTAVVTVALHDSGGTANGGQDTSAVQTFSITLTPAIIPDSGTGGGTSNSRTIDVSVMVFDTYDQPNGNRTALAGRTVFEDANDNGQLDPGELTAVTGLDGRYRFSLPAGSHTFRLAPKAGWTTPDGYAAAATIDWSGGLAALYTTMADPVVIDVLAVHPAPVTIVDYTLPWDSAIRNAFAAANAIFANSDTNIRLNLVAIDSVKYTPANNLKLDLARLYTVGDGALDTVPRRRDLLQADLAILFDAKPDGHFSGMAPVLNPAHPDASRGYAVVVASNSSTEGGAVLAHEIGHTLGADHDLANGPANYVSNAHGYRFTGDDGVLYHDVMAYPPGTTLPFFSSPNQSYAGHALGTAASADAARVVRENAYTVASYRGPVVSAPASLAAITAAVTKSTAKPGDAVTAKATVRNNAVSKFSGKVAVAYYLSKDKVLDTSDVVIKRTSVMVKNLAAKGTLASSVAFKVDAKLAAGTYYLLAVATPTGVAADERAAKAASAALKVAAPLKKKTNAKVVAAGFQSARPIVEQAAGAERTNDDADDVITGLLLSSK